ncbi:hypothetical protein D3C87_2093640 [compost metagenome]
MLEFRDQLGDGLALLESIFGSSRAGAAFRLQVSQFLLTGDAPLSEIEHLLFR